MHNYLYELSTHRDSLKAKIFCQDFRECFCRQILCFGRSFQPISLRTLEQICQIVFLRSPQLAKE